MNVLQGRLFILETKYREKRNAPQNKNLRVFYGWAKIGKIRKKEALRMIGKMKSGHNALFRGCKIRYIPGFKPMMRLWMPVV